MLTKDDAGHAINLYFKLEELQKQRASFAGPCIVRIRSTETAGSVDLPSNSEARKTVVDLALAQIDIQIGVITDALAKMGFAPWPMWKNTAHTSRSAIWSSCDPAVQ